MVGGRGCPLDCTYQLRDKIKDMVTELQIHWLLQGHTNHRGNQQDGELLFTFEYKEAATHTPIFLDQSTLSLVELSIFQCSVPLVLLSVNHLRRSGLSLLLAHAFDNHVAFDDHDACHTVHGKPSHLPLAYFVCTDDPAKILHNTAAGLLPRAMDWMRNPSTARTQVAKCLVSTPDDPRLVRSESFCRVPWSTWCLECRCRCMPHWCQPWRNWSRTTSTQTGSSFSSRYSFWFSHWFSVIWRGTGGIVTPIQCQSLGIVAVLAAPESQWGSQQAGIDGLGVHGLCLCIQRTSTVHMRVQSTHNEVGRDKKLSFWSC
jgi:hypothetical protein